MAGAFSNINQFKVILDTDFSLFEKYAKLD